MSRIGSNQYHELQSEIVDLQAKESQLDELIHNTTLQLQLLTDQDSRYPFFYLVVFVELLLLHV